MRDLHGDSRLSRAAGAALFVLGLAVPGCSGRDPNGGSPPVAEPATWESAQVTSPRVTFVELGSENCIPCMKMRLVMQEIEQQYGDQVRMVFHDVLKPEGQQYARLYRIRIMPTQVFLDAEGREYFRHEGYFPTAEVVKVLAIKGVK